MEKGQEDLFYVDGMEKVLQNYIELESNTEDEVTYKLVLSDKAFNPNGLMDEGLLIALIDSYSSYASFLISKVDKKEYSLSLNIKMTSIDYIKKNNVYFMKVKIADESNKKILFDVNIYDKDGKLIKKASHLKKIIKPKY